MVVHTARPLRTVTASSPLPVMALPVVEEIALWMPLGERSCRKLKLALKELRSEK